MAKVDKKAFEHFKGVYELHCGWIVEDEYYENVIEPEWKKMRHTQLLAEFSFKCLYDGEKPLSKRDYGRVRFTHRKITEKMSTLSQVRTKSENNAFQRVMRRLKLEKGLYPFKTNGKSIDELIEENEEFKRFVEEGRYKKGGFIDKFVKDIHRI